MSSWWRRGILTLGIGMTLLLGVTMAAFAQTASGGRQALAAADGNLGGNSGIGTGAGASNVPARQQDGGTGDTTRRAPGPAVPLQWWLVIVYAILLAGIPFSLHILDSTQAYKTTERTRKSLVGKLSQPQTAEQVGTVMAEIAKLSKSQTGVPGTTRSILTYMLLTVLGLAVFHLLALDGDEKRLGLADKILTLLAGSVATIIGFYFGTKATAEGASAQRDADTKESAKITSRIIAAIPQTAKAGEEIQIVGFGFGDAKGGVEIDGNAGGDIVRWSDTVIVVRIPAGLTPGPKSTTVKPSGGGSITATNLITVAP